MKIIFQTRKQFDAAAEKELQRNMAASELLKLTGRLLTVSREARDFLKAIGPQSVWDSPHCTNPQAITSYEDLMTKLNSVLEGRNDGLKA